jgi:hypothetical protein
MWILCTSLVIELVSFTRCMELLADEFLLHAVHIFLGIIILFLFLYVVFPFTPLPKCVFKVPYFCLYTKLFFCMLTPFPYLAGVLFYAVEQL